MTLLIVKSSLVLIAVIGFVGCGTFENLSNVYDAPLNEPDVRYKARFSDAAALILENGFFKTTAYGTGGTYLPSRAVLAEAGDYTVASEAEVYLPYSGSRNDIKAAIIRQGERVGGMKNILLKNGEPLFLTADPVNSAGNSVVEVSDGVAPASGEDHFVSIVMNAASLKLKGIIKSTIADDNGVIKFDITNATALTTKILFSNKTVINSGDLFIKTELYPYKKGYLVYSLTKIKAASSMVEKRLSANMLPPCQIASIGYILSIK